MRPNEAADIIRDVNAATAEDERRKDIRPLGEKWMTKQRPVNGVPAQGPDQRDRDQIERQAQWRLPRGSLSRQVLALLERVEALEAEVRSLRERLLP